MWESILASSITLIGFIVAFIIIYYLFSFTKMKKQKKYFADLHTGLAVGQKVQLSRVPLWKSHVTLSHKLLLKQ